MSVGQIAEYTAIAGFIIVVIGFIYRRWKNRVRAEIRQDADHAKDSLILWGKNPEYAGTLALVSFVLTSKMDRSISLTTVSLAGCPLRRDREAIVGSGDYFTVDDGSMNGSTVKVSQFLATPPLPFSLHPWESKQFWAWVDISGAGLTDRKEHTLDLVAVVEETHKFRCRVTLHPLRP